MNKMTETERVELDNELALFLTSCANNIQSLRSNYCGLKGSVATSMTNSRHSTGENSIGADGGFVAVAGSASNNSDNRECRDGSMLLGLTVSHGAHYDCVATYLVEKLRVLAKRSQQLKKQRVKFNSNPLRLLTGSGGAGACTEPTVDVIASQRIDNVSPSITTTASITATSTATATDSGSVLKETKQGTTKRSSSTVLDSDFVSRYEVEIASPKRLQEYNNIATKHKESLLRETTILRSQFDSQLTVAHGMESNIESISSMLSEFLHIIESQSDQILDIRDVSKEATISVTKASDELELTISRNQSYQINMVILIVGLALLLLVLDFITP